MTTTTQNEVIWQTDATNRLYRLVAELGPGAVMITISRQHVILDNSQAAASVWLMVSRIICPWPGSLDEIWKFFSHCCEFYDPDLRPFVPRIINRLTEIPELAGAQQPTDPMQKVN